MPVEYRGHLGILVTLLLHDVAPVAGKITTRDKQELAAFFSLRESCLSPIPPINRIVTVHGEIG